MKKLFLTTVAALVAALGLSTNARAQIAVGTNGSTTYTFSTAPTAAEFATSGGIGSSATTYTTAADLATAVQALNQSSMTTTLPTITANGTSVNGRYNSAGGYLVTQPTTVGAALIKATLRNTSTNAYSRITVGYNFGVAVTTTTETAPGHEAFYSTNGQPNTWVHIAEFSGLNAAAAVSATLDVGVWVPGQDLYIVWADDNGNTNPDGAYTIDNFAVSGVVVTNVTVPPSATLTAPANFSVYTTSPANPANVTVTANASAVPSVTSVTFYTNGVAWFVDTTAPYSNQLVNLPAGTYTIYAKASNGVDADGYSATNTIYVRNEFVSYTGGTLTENFDGMGSAGTINGTNTLTPVGWYVGTGLPANTSVVTVGDGSIGAIGTVAGWNYGNSGASDRSLGTAPTGNNREMVVRIQNTMSSNITAFEVRYDGEVWRNYTNDVDGWLTNYYSLDNGTTWTATGFDFDQPAGVLRQQPQGGVDGKQSSNRTPGIGGIVDLSATPLVPGGVIYIRWHDFNGAGVTDGGEAIDNVTFHATSFSQAQIFVTITSPTAGQSISAGCGSSANVTVNANASFMTTNVAFKLDNGTAVNDTTVPYSVTFNTVGIGNHTVTAVATDTAGSKATNTVTFTVAGNIAPLVNFTNTFSGSDTGLVFLTGTPVTNQFGVSDPDGTVSSIAFVVNGTVIYSTNVNYGQLIVNNLLEGTNTFVVRATDNCGGISEATRLVIGTNYPGVSVVVSNGAQWKYLDNGSDQGTAWQAPGFDDSTWSVGYAELGYGDAVSPPNTVPERTIVGFGPNASTKYPTTYFRKSFNVANPGAFSGYILRILKDDHAIVYLNGTKVYSDVTNEVVTYQSLVQPAIGHDGTVYDQTNVPAGLVVSGNNVLAVEVHQDSLTSSDLSFDLMLWGAAGGGPRLTVAQTDATHVSVTWGSDAAGYTLQKSTTLLSGSWTAVGGVTDPLPGAGSTSQTTGGTPTFYRLFKP